ncbi:hypothetical protein EA58_08775 [Photobacterium galatheae]|uniref:Uncharacterized protein n=1 Tax=Photobacterium galatheae TaxID=1654360 RepID=A0A066RN97_9GAMM|nr:hypothetical protein EA58_08775 [Photobacterium galatheae]
MVMFQIIKNPELRGLLSLDPDSLNQRRFKQKNESDSVPGIVAFQNSETLPMPIGSVNLLTTKSIHLIIVQVGCGGRI